MEDEITKRGLSDDELDNVSGGGCEENAQENYPQVEITKAKKETIFSREDGSQVECANAFCRVLENLILFPKSLAHVPFSGNNPQSRIDDNRLRDFL